MRTLSRIVSLILVITFIITSAAYGATLPHDSTLRQISARISSAGPDEIAGDLKDVGSIEVPLSPEKPSSAGEGFTFEQVMQSVKQSQFLRETTPAAFLEQLGADRKTQQFVINGMGILTEYYLWIEKDYINQAAVAGQAGEVLRETRNDIYKPTLDALMKIAKRITDKDLVANAAILRLSENDNQPTVNVGNKKITVGFLPMKGDPWQMGHLWVILKLLADGADVAVIMLDNSDPDRKPDLTALPIRLADSKWLFNLLSPFVVPTDFQKEYRPLFNSDGETILPTLIYENRAIAHTVTWLYDAGYDHFNWTVTKKGKRLLDVPYKLAYGLQLLLRAGVDASICAKFQYRADDSEDDADAVKKRIAAIEAAADISNMEFLTTVMLKWVQEKIDAEGEDFWADIKQVLEQHKKETITHIKQQLTKEQAALLEDMLSNAAKALETADDNLNVHNWFDRFAQASKWHTGEVSYVFMQELTGTLETLKQSAEKEPDNNQKAQQAVADLYKHLLSRWHMIFNVLEQPMNTSSTKVREKGLLYTVAGVPFADSIKGLRRYPSVQDSKINKVDKDIAARVLGQLIDIDTIDRRKYGNITEYSVRKHLGKNMSSLVNVSLLTKILRERFAEGGLSSALYYNESRFNEALAGMRQNLSQAHGKALHAVDGYLIKLFIEDSSLEYMKSKIAANAGEEESVKMVRNVIDGVRSLIYDRAAQVIAESRASHLASTLTKSSSAGAVKMLGISIAEGNTPKQIGNLKIWIRAKKQILSQA